MVRTMPSFLLVRFSSLGDVALATAAARLLKERRPGCRVVLATKAAYGPLLAAQPDLDEVWTLGPEGLAGLLRRTRAARFDAVVDLHANTRSRVLAAFSGSAVARWRPEAWNRRLRVLRPSRVRPWPDPVYVRYAAAAARALGEPLGRAPLPRLGVAAEAAEWAEAWLRDRGLRPGQRLLVVAPGAAWPTKRWGLHHLAQCLDLVSEFERVAFLLTGSPSEAPLLDALEGACRKSRPLLRRCEGDTADLSRLAALLARGHAFLGNDSGPMHVAAALGVPVTALFGPTVGAFGFFPAGEGHRVFERDLGCRPCSLHGSRNCPLGHHDCMETLEPFEVAAHLRRVLGLEAPPR